MNVDIFMQFYKDKFHFPNVAQRELNCDHIENKIYDINITLFFIKKKTLFVFKMAKKWVKTFFYCVFFLYETLWTLYFMDPNIYGSYFSDSISRLK